MKIRKLAVILITSIVLPATSLAAECVLEVELIRNELSTGACSDDLGWGPKGEAICVRLDSKLTGAIDKLESEKRDDKKVQDALDKLESFQATIDHLAGKGIVESGEQSTLTSLTDTAENCINGLFST